MARTGGTNAERILAALAGSPGLDDDELSLTTGIRPRQQVNQICRRLEAAGLIHRAPGVSGKIANFPVRSAAGRSRLPPSESGPSRKPGPGAVLYAGKPTERPRRPALVLTERSRKDAIMSPVESTLFILPCSAAKGEFPGTNRTGPTILDELPPDLASRLP